MVKPCPRLTPKPAGAPCPDSAPFAVPSRVDATAVCCRKTKPRPKKAAVNACPRVQTKPAGAPCPPSAPYQVTSKTDPSQECCRKTKPQASVQLVAKAPRCGNVAKAMPFRNPGNMCYMNTVLVVLMVVFPKFCNRYMYNRAGGGQCKRELTALLRQEQQYMQASMHAGRAPTRHTCLNIMAKLNECQSMHQFGNVQNDPRDVLQALFTVYDIGQRVRWQGDTVTTPLLLGNWDGSPPSVADALHTAEYQYLPDQSPPLLVVYQNRVGYVNVDGVFTVVKMLDKLSIPQEVGGKRLFAIIVHIGDTDSGHYIAYLRYPSPERECRYRWYMYNDLKSKVVDMGPFSRMMEMAPQGRHPETNGVLFFYWDTSRGTPVQ